MNNKIDDEIDIYLDLLGEELNQLPAEILSGSSIWKELCGLLNHEYVDSQIYMLNKHLFHDFFNLLKAYNDVGEIEIFETLNNKASDLLGLLKIFNSESDSIATINNKESNTTLEKRIKNLKKELLKIEQQHKDISELNKSVILSQNEANRIISELKDKNEAYSQLIDEDSNARILKLYNDIYNREVEVANKYRNWALGIFSAIGSILIWKLFNLSLGFNNWGISFSIPSKVLGWEYFINVLVLVGLSTPAWYLTRESSKHRKVAYKAQSLGTELAAFPLYAREFKDEDRLELRKILADRFFGQEPYSDSKTASNSDNSLEQVKLLTEANKVLAESFKMKKSVENS